MIHGIFNDGPAVTFAPQNSTLSLPFSIKIFFMSRYLNRKIGMSLIRKFFCTLVVSCCLYLLWSPEPAMAQKTIGGVVTDAKTGDTLPSANILVKGTYRGTISNANGAYTLAIPDSLLPATVVVRFIGYRTIERQITADSPAGQDFSLEPSVLQLGKITVTGEDPGVRIMREVIRRKQQWRKELETYRAEAYTRQTLANDTSIVMITESASTAYWDRQRGHREVIKSRRQTANMARDQNFAGVRYLPNFYDDNVQIAGFDVVGVTHPDALDYYEFSLNGRNSLDGQTVYEIGVEPKRKLQPLFRGTVWVLDEAYALLEVRLKPNEVVRFPPPVKSFDTYYEQQFNNFGRDFWLPVDVRIEGDVKISMVGLDFPVIRFRQLSHLTDYRVNVELPDSLFERDNAMTVDSASARGDSLLLRRSVEAVPLTNEEQQAYRDLDSTATLEKAFKPSGFLSRFVDTSDEENGGNGPGFLDNIPGSFSPALRYNRVDELYAGLKYEVNPFSRVHISGEAGYSTGYESWNFGAGVEYTVIRRRGFRQAVGAEWKAETQTRFNSGIYTPAYTIFSNLLGATNYFDYYRNEGFHIRTKATVPQRDLSLAVQFNAEDHSSLPASSAYDFLGRDNALQLNPPVDEGRLYSLTLEGGYNLDEEYAFGVTGLERIGFGMERSLPSAGSDYRFTSWSFTADWSFQTFFKRRFLANTLDIHMAGGTSTGTVPLQKWGIVDGALGYFSPFGALKSIRNRPYEGEKYISAVAEHNFRTIPFEMLGLDMLAERNLGIIIFGGAAKTWIPDSRRRQVIDIYNYNPQATDGLHLEAGVSLNGILGLFRVDFARRLDEPAFLVNISIARLF